MTAAIAELEPEELIARYDVVLLDAYGVLVDHATALPGAARFLERLEAAGRRWLVLSNDASRLPDTAAARFARLGLPIPAERIVLSGEALMSHFERRGLAGRRCVVLGPADSVAWVERAGGLVVPWSVPNADPEVVVVADDEGYPFLEAIEAVIAHVIARRDTGLSTELVLPNPDLVYPKGPGALGLTAGSIAHLIEIALAQRYPDDPPRFVALGKPHPMLFSLALQRVGASERDRVVMVGDQLHTDVLGAIGVGIDAVLVASGVALTTPMRGDGPRPTFLMRALR